MTLPKAQHIPVLVSLRGLAALMVVLFHFVVKTKDFIDAELARQFFGKGHFGVQIFFVISGVVIPLSLINAHYKFNQIGKFLWKRCIRIEPPYLAAIGLALIYLYGRDLIPGTISSDFKPGIKDVLLHLGYLVPFVDNARWISDVFWTLAIEFQYYLLIAITIPLALSRFESIKWLLFTSFAISAFLPLEDKWLFHWSPIFLAGILFAFYYCQRISSRSYIASQLVCFVIIYYKLGASNFIAALVPVVVLHLWPSYRTKLSNYFGEISYSLYLIHMITGGAVVNYLSHHANAPWHCFLIVCLGLAIAVISSHFFHRFIETPSQRLAQKITYKSKAVSQ